MLQRIQQWPYGRILLPFLVGILVGIQWYLNYNWLLPFWIGAIIASLVFHFNKRINKDKGLQHWFGGSVSITLLITGILLVSTNRPEHSPNYYGKYLAEANSFVVSITNPPIEKPSSVKLEVLIDAVSSNEGKYPASGKAIIYLNKDDKTLSLKYGDQLLLFNQLERIAPPLNPHEFDYRQLMRNRGVLYSGFYRTGQYQVLETNKGNPILKHIYQLRDNASTLLQKHTPSQEAYGVISTLLLGMRENIPDTINQSYSNTGIVHILAISGLHVGIIYILMVFLLSGIPNQLKWLRAALIFLVIWSFTILSGFSPSVIRAAIMFSFLIVAGNLSKQLNSINALAASAFFILLFDPFQVMEVGFQLSYLAVAGILIIYRPLYKLLYIPNKFIDKIWSLTAVSITAQIATFPLVLYYFHQFPTYFLLTNLIAIPTAFLLVVLGIATLTTSWLPPIAGALGKLVSFIIDLFHQFLNCIEQLPYLTLKGTVNTLETLLLYTIIALGLASIIHQQKKYFPYLLFSILLFNISLTVNDYQQLKQQQFIVYAVKGHAAYNFISGSKHTFISRPPIPEKDIDYHIAPNWLYNGLIIDEALDSTELVRVDHYLLFGDEKIVIIDSALGMKNTGAPLVVDVLILSQNPRLDIEDLLNHYQPKEIVLDASIYPSKAQKWKAECLILGIPCYNVRESGAYIKPSL